MRQGPTVTGPRGDFQVGHQSLRRLRDWMSTSLADASCARRVGWWLQRLPEAIIRLAHAGRLSGMTFHLWRWWKRADIESFMPKALHAGGADPVICNVTASWFVTLCDPGVLEHALCQQTPHLAYAGTGRVTW